MDSLVSTFTCFSRNTVCSLIFLFRSLEHQYLKCTVVADDWPVTVFSSYRPTMCSSVHCLMSLSLDFFITEHYQIDTWQWDPPLGSSIYSPSLLPGRQMMMNAFDNFKKAWSLLCLLISGFSRPRLRVKHLHAGPLSSLNASHRCW